MTTVEQLLDITRAADDLEWWLGKMLASPEQLGIQLTADRKEAMGEVLFLMNRLAEVLHPYRMVHNPKRVAQCDLDGTRWDAA